jgi:hypothetical protein
MDNNTKPLQNKATQPNKTTDKLKHLSIQYHLENTPYFTGKIRKHPFFWKKTGHRTEKPLVRTYINFSNEPLMSQSQPHSTLPQTFLLINFTFFFNSPDDTVIESARANNIFYNFCTTYFYIQFFIYKFLQ